MSEYTPKCTKLDYIKKKDCDSISLKHDVIQNHPFFPKFVPPPLV